MDEGISLTVLTFLTVIFNNNNNDNNNNNTYVAPISILLFSSALKNKNIKMKLPTRVKTILSTLNYKNYLDYLNRKKNCIMRKPTKNEIKKHIKSQLSEIKMSLVSF